MANRRESSDEIDVNNFFRLRRSDFIPVMGVERYIRRTNAFYRSLKNGSPEEIEIIGCNDEERVADVLSRNDEARTRAVGLLYYNIGIATPIILALGHYLTNQ